MGFEGFCPVTMKNEWRWARGDVRWGAIHQGRTYLFASEDAQRAFLATNDRGNAIGVSKLGGTAAVGAAIGTAVAGPVGGAVGTFAAPALATVVRY
jgi:hypothetical protein